MCMWVVRFLGDIYSCDSRGRGRRDLVVGLGFGVRMIFFLSFIIHVIKITLVYIRKKKDNPTIK